jgi:hypothetical protein
MTIFPSKRGRPRKSVPVKIKETIHEEKIGLLKLQQEILVRDLNNLKITILDQAAVIRYLENKLEKK